MFEAMRGVRRIDEWRRVVKTEDRPKEGSRATVSAIKDPQGARRALWEYGKLTNWPHLTLGRLELQGGEINWVRALRASEPLWLGIAWDTIETYEANEAKKRQTAIPTFNTQTTNDKETDPMPVLPWTEATGVEAGDYSAIITEIEDEEGTFGPQIRLQFVILDDDGDQATEQIRGWCSAKWGEKTKLYKWTRAILGKKCPAPGQPFDTDKLKMKRCDIRVEEKPGQNGPRSSIAEVYPFRTINRVEADEEQPEPARKVAPVMAGRKGPVVAPPSAEDDEPDDIPF